MPGLKVGDRVRHARWGDGSVAKVYHGGGEGLVMFDQGFIFRINGISLRPVEPEGGGEPAPAACPANADLKRILREGMDQLRKRASEKRIAQTRPKGVEALPRPRSRPAPLARPGKVAAGEPFLPAHLRSRQVLEAFRMGIVPHHAIEDWTFGREEEIGRLSSWLRDDTEGALLLEGAYGSGKTHLMEHLSHHARKLGFAAAMVRMDPGGGSTSFPWRLYREILRTLRIPSPAGDTDVREALESQRRGIAALGWTLEHPLLGPFFRALEKGRLGESDWQAFLGEKADAAHFAFSGDFTTVGNVVCNLLGTLANVLVRCCGANGLLLLLDETETARTCLYNFHWIRSLNFLRGLTLTANDEPDLTEEGVSLDNNGTYTGERTGLVYAGHWKRIRYVERVPTFLKIVVSITPGSFSPKFREWRKSLPLLELEQVGRLASVALIEAVNAHYRSVYGAGLSPEEAVLAMLQLEGAGPGRSTRTLIKGVLDLLDFRRFYPTEPLRKILS